MQWANYSRLALLLFSYTLVVLYYCWAYSGHFGYDDMQYAAVANGILNGTVDYSDHFYYRTPIVYLTALAYSIFGITDFASALPALLMMGIILWVVYRVLRQNSVYTLAIGLGLTVLNGWLLFYSSKLMPDIHLAASVLGIVALVHAYKFRRRRYSVHAYALGFALLLLFGFMAKGVIILIAPLLAYWFVLDLLQRKDQTFWWSAVFYSVGALAVYFLATGIVTGDPWMRFRAISDNSYLNACSYDQQPLAFVLKRVGYQFFELLYRDGMLLGLLLAVPLLFSGRKHNWWKFDDPSTFWSTSALLLVFSANFMSVSPVSYSPLCLDPRHYLFLVPVFAIAGAYGTETFLDKPTISWLSPVILLVAALLGWFQYKSLFSTEYALLALLFAAYLFARPSRLTKTIFVVACFLILVFRLYSSTEYFKSIRYPEQRSFIYQQLLNGELKGTVLTDPVMARLGRYYTGFNDSSSVRFLSYLDSKPTGLDSSVTTYLLKNWHTTYLSNLDQNDLPTFARNPEAIEAVLIAEQSITHTTLFTLTAGKEQFREIAEELWNTQTGFEKPARFWLIDSSKLEKEVVFQGITALRASEYAGTLSYPLDSLESLFEAGGEGSILLRAQVNCNFSGPTTAVLCMTIEDSMGIYHYFTKPVGKYLKAYNNWWPIDYEERLELKSLKPGSRLKVYLWNKDLDPGYVDDFSVQISPTR